MKFFPIRVAIVCLLVPPVLYILTLMICENRLTLRYQSRIQNILIGDARPLLDGSIPLEQQVADNIQRFLKQDRLSGWAGIDLRVMVTTARGRVLYPVYMDIQFPDTGTREEAQARETARANFDLLNQGLQVHVELYLGHGSVVANLILVLYFGASLFVFWLFYRAGSSAAAMDRQKNTQLISALKEEEKNHLMILEELKKERRDLFENIKSLNARYEEDHRKAKVNEEEMFQEIVSLEEKINAFLEFKKIKEKEIEDLKSQIQTFERRRTPKIKRNEFDFTAKRFAVLYKSITMNRKALTGFFNLDEDQQIKVEELIHLMDRDPEKVVIKRKVFAGKKHRTPCFEVLFAYNGRLYFKKNENNVMEILVIGTKNTQDKDMEFIHNL